MTRKKTTVQTGLVVLACCLTFACAAPKIKQNVMMPANAPGMQQAKKVAVVNFAGDRNGEFTSKMETFFSNIQVQRQPYFTVVDRNTLATILSERNLVRNNGAAQPELQGQDAVKLGQLTGADTILTGFVKWPQISDKATKEKRTKCVKQADKKSKGLLGIKYRKCLEEKEFIVNCNTQLGEFNFTLKAVSVNNGQVVHTKAYKADTAHKYCADEKSNGKKDTAQLVKALMDDAIRQMRRDVAPYSMLLTIELMDDDDSELGDNGHAKALLESGLEFAKNNRMARACGLFQEAAQSYDESPAIYHNLGVCAEIKKDFKTAASHYMKADQLLLKPEKLISAALMRVAEREQKEKEVAKQLRP